MLTRHIYLQTPTGCIPLNINISFDSVDLNEASEMTIRTFYQGQEIVVHGAEYPFIDAYAKLQKRLPADVKLKCCAACRHGNMCPVGNAPDQVFCTKDLHISRKNDLYSCTEEPEETMKRSRHYSDLCEDFAPQSDSYYTYSDYYSFL